jgi:hypothetical protein
MQPNSNRLTRLSYKVFKQFIKFKDKSKVDCNNLLVSNNHLKDIKNFFLYVKPCEQLKIFELDLR